MAIINDLKLLLIMLVTDLMVVGIFLICLIGIPFFGIGRLIKSPSLIAIGLVAICSGAICLAISTKDSEKERADRSFYKAATKLNARLTSKIVSEANSELQLLIANYQVSLGILVTLLAVFLTASLSSLNWIYPIISIIVAIVLAVVYVKYRIEIKKKVLQIREMEDKRDERDISFYETIKGLKSILVIIALSSLALSLALYKINPTITFVVSLAMLLSYFSQYISFHYRAPIFHNTET
jgi:hypothetical protein